jgi:hypothetical protein
MRLIGEQNMAKEKKKKAGASSGKHLGRQRNPPPPQQETGDAAVRLIAASTLKKLANEVIGYKTAAGSANGSAGAAIKEYVARGLNAPAFSIAVRFLKKAKKDVLAARAQRDALLQLFDDIGVNDLINRGAADFFKDAADAGAAADAADSGDGERVDEDNVTRLHITGVVAA